MLRALLVIVLLSLCAAACGGHTTANSSASNGVAYAQCMRNHGVASWPDPNASGSFDKSKLTPQQLHVGNSVVRSAQRACHQLLPASASGPTPAQVAQYRAHMLVYAACIRTHGVPNMPDPDSRGHLDIGPGTDIDVNCPKFEAAFAACKSKLQP